MKLAVLGVALIAATGVTATASAEGDVDAGRLKAQTCLGCHGNPGMRNAYPGYHVPKLGGQHAQYIIAALKNYKDGMRSHPTMRAQASDLSDQDMADIAAYFSSLKQFSASK